jgi:Na+/H+ antiporter NhaD/arsenite permease-like protein
LRTPSKTSKSQQLLVKAIAEHAGVKMPSFFGYLAWSLCILLPLFVVVTVIFFR